ncbi:MULTISPECIES: HGGxSTG domain-containing protein [Xanthomonas]|jgi:hypothetical protein|uniref:Uncharacterized protein n=4 Tax=Xanthomonas TaxID=338 RepID=A0A2N3RI71_9XANT|nr:MULTISPECIES: HGGxSTG domain-containing protein [Xanthomonas]ASW45375.1 hypothetical protein XJ27_04835 [Xanthomonas hortorum]KAB0537911.1 hypothetical protein F7R02_05980 [Xanthomonas cissicola]KOA98553.1 hypothetical protein AE920_14685 [Xanthomonas arboricola]KOB16803.1 hypothetical protein AE924_06540 [Xanthomonas arboricola]KOB35746.1 hypothetical protein AE929_09895 [Xanthomonas arboricola]
MHDRYLSGDKLHLAKLQRERRATMRRIDYMPGRRALAVFEARQAQERPRSIEATNSAVLDAILIEWAELTGVKYSQVGQPKATAPTPELTDHFARARLTSAPLPELMLPSRACAHAYDSGRAGNQKITARPYQRANKCGATRHRDGQPCQAKPEPGKLRCRFHGGRSTGPRTDEGKAKALSNLKQYKG